MKPDSATATAAHPAVRSPASSSPTATSSKLHATRTRTRFVILALLAIGTLINYLDRTVLGIAAPVMTKELQISAAIMGLVFSAFSWTYAVAQIPGGVFLDRFGNRLTYFLALTFWSLFTMFQGFAVGIKSLLLFRFGLGVSEAPCFPTNSRVVGTWFPQHERARATGIYTVGEYLGLACFAPALFWIMGNFGWRSLFIVVGLVGIAFALVWWAMYREPHESKSVNQAELDYIAAGGGLEQPSQQHTPFSWSNVVKLLSVRQIWGAAIGQFAGNTTLVFFLTWFPTYLAVERHMGWLKVGFFAIMPFLAAAVGVMFGGWFSDWLLKRTGSANMARKLPIIFGLLAASTIVAANFVDNDTTIIAILSFAFFGQGMVGLGWTLISDVAPKKLMGLTGGIFNTCSNLAGIVTPLVIGFIISATGSFFYALAYVGAAALLGVLSYVFVVGDVHRVEID
ncbi:ACS family D-galactonate transporter-like MFS transporter [Herbaspirillum sp. Sphag1AN]|uniref:MFS transporter n=1 Tax=unclassified Herbaspirillum TaxID=2624150 RepID=UPI0016086FEE|nr:MULTISPECIES: MFS transporter [unclassified Herbaspirillum]MBB3213521.1 ACS family D-galactonate transporter-like MFS transporter [Herbaspirillum sp. Sphag1AN]MBB3246719.1 ACS family D-galactonate transporter-like MFS transporter [Herbaspirillum sp. Sphag64]